MSVSRVVTLFTPVFAALAGYVATQAARLPGAPSLSRDELTVLFVAGATSGTAAAVKWLDGRARHERQASDEAQERDRWDAYDPDRFEDADTDEGPDLPELSEMRFDIGTIEAIRSVSGVRAAASDAARALQAVRSLDARLEALEVPVPGRPESSQ